MNNKDYIPAGDAGFDKWFIFLVQYVTARCAGETWTHIPQAALTGLDGARSAWTAAYAKVQGPHTKVDTEAKNDAKKAAKAVLRPFVNQYLRYLPVTNEDRTAMAIPNHDTRLTKTPAPAGIPEVEAQTPHPRVLSFRFRGAGRKRWGKPEGVHGMELVWLLSDTPPKLVEDLVHSSFATKSPLVLTFEENERGKRLYYAVRWETGTVKKGDFSEIFLVFVP
ncbi:MAG: hypothetical protein LBJ24_06265 [Treponema sp.]|jgi:hypothetical protein|nr:hypothetical protein [Treponema sp.]